MVRDIKNTVASVHQRLLNKAKVSNCLFNELLQYFALERFIYRLTKSPHGARFILKGALMFLAWSGPKSRPTMDIDFLGRIDNDLDVIVAAMKDVCNTDVDADGMSFDAESVTAVRITEDAEYEGVRVRINGNLGNARLSLHVDVGFGDVVVPGPKKIVYPTLLDFPPPKLNGYTMESTIAEKFQAMVKLGVLNSRMKDFYDIWTLSRKFDFKGGILTEAVEKTFRNRKTPVTAFPTVFKPSFMEDRDKNNQWLGFIRKSKLINCPESFLEVASSIKTFMEPVMTALVNQAPFKSTWKAPGLWL